MTTTPVCSKCGKPLGTALPPVPGKGEEIRKMDELKLIDDVWWVIRHGNPMRPLTDKEASAAIFGDVRILREEGVG